MIPARPSERFRLRSVAFTAYGPTLVSSLGHGAVLPVLALRARELGADVGTAAFVVALLGVGQLIASLPAGALVARVGERRALLLAGLLDAAAMITAFRAPSVVTLAAAVTVSGMTWTVFLLARQGFMIDAVPPSHRARALSTLGGSHRVGLFVGPLVGAVLIGAHGTPVVFLLAAAMSALSAAMALVMPDLGRPDRQAQQEAGHAGVLSVLRVHRQVLLTLGTAVMAITAARALRNSLLPLWAEAIGLSAVDTSLVFGLAGLVDMLLFYPAGWVMDRHGRAWVAVPVVLTVAAGSLLLPLAGSMVGLTAVALLMAVGNGMGAGIVMTLGADAAPVSGRAQFLGGWRLCGDVGATGGPLIVSAVTLVAPLALACLVTGGMALAGAAWVARWTRRVDLARVGSPVPGQ